MVRKFGWIPDVPDGRDYKFYAMPRAKLPESVDLRQFDSPIEDQGSTNSCVGQSVIACYEFLHKRKYSKYQDFSRLFPYYNARIAIGMENFDSGCMIRDAVKSLVKDGVCTEKLWPFETNRITVRPTADAYAEAGEYQLLDYYRISPQNRLYDTMYALSCGYAVVFGMSIYSSFMSPEVAKTGIVPMPDISKDRLIGGHAMKISGFKNGNFIIKNSWGISFGDKGYIYVPKEIIENDDLSDDFWVMKLTEHPPDQISFPWYSNLWRYLRYVFYW